MLEQRALVGHVYRTIVAHHRNFTGPDWYPVDERDRVHGKCTPHDEPMTVKTMNIRGDIETYTCTGYVTLTVAAQRCACCQSTLARGCGSYERQAAFD